MNNLDMLAKLQFSLFKNNLDCLITIAEKTTISVEDIHTKTTIAVVSGDTLEDAYANLLGVCVSSVRDLKLGKYNWDRGLSFL